MYMYIYIYIYIYIYNFLSKYLTIINFYVSTSLLILTTYVIIGSHQMILLINDKQLYNNLF